MKQVHYRSGDVKRWGTREQYRTIPTLCGTTARSLAKATTDPAKVTCAYCINKLRKV